MRSTSFNSLSVRQNVPRVAALLFLCGCEASLAPASAGSSAAVQDQAAGMPVRPTPPVLEVKAPTYPPLAIYIVYREYVYQNPGLTMLSDDDPRYQRYMERRLRELYPTRGYEGMMRDAVAEARRNRLLVRQYEREMRDYDRRMRTSWAAPASFVTTSTCETSYVDSNAGADSSWSGHEEFAVPPDEQLPTIQMEIDTLQLEGPEVDAIHYYEALATGTYAPGGGPGGGDSINMTGVEGGPTRDDLIHAAAAGQLSGEGVTAQVSEQLLATIALGVVGAWKAHRVQQASDRAHRKSTGFYPGVDPQDTRRDAHRHVYVNMMLRRYVGATAAKIIADRHENQNENVSTARVMDLHNNDIGRSVRYNAFRGHWLWDRWDWQEWAEKVRNYIDNPMNAEYIPEWAVEPRPTTDQAWEREACVLDAKYIYFSINPTS